MNRWNDRGSLRLFTAHITPALVLTDNRAPPEPFGLWATLMKRRPLSSHGLQRSRHYLHRTKKAAGSSHLFARLMTKRPLRIGRVRGGNSPGLPAATCHHP